MLDQEQSLALPQSGQSTTHRSWLSLLVGSATVSWPWLLLWAQETYQHIGLHALCQQTGLHPQAPLPPGTDPASYPGEETGLDHQSLGPRSVCTCDVPGDLDSLPNLSPFCTHSLSQCCHGVRAIHHNSFTSGSWNGVYGFCSRVLGSWTCVSSSAFSSGIDQDHVQ